MKKILSLITILIMFLPFIVHGETCATDKITIESIVSGDKTDNVKEINKAVAKGNKVNLDLSMSEARDSIEYKLIFKNDSNEDYEIDKTSIKINENYINYSLETEDKSNIVKAHSTKNVILTITYKNEYPNNYFKNGEYTDNKIMNLSLQNRPSILDIITNPKTSTQFYIILIMFIMIISLILYITLKKRKYTKYLIILMCLTILIPIMVNALCKYEIIIESKIKIEKKYNVYLRRYGYIPEDKLNNYYINLYSMEKLFDDDNCSDNYVIYENQKYYNCQTYDKVASYHYKELVAFINNYSFEQIDLTDCEDNICSTMTTTTRSYYRKTLAYPYYQEDDWEIMSEGMDYGWSQLDEEGSPPLIALGNFIMPMHDVFLTDTFSYSGMWGVRPVYN